MAEPNVFNLDAEAFQQPIDGLFVPMALVEDAEEVENIIPVANANNPLQVQPRPVNPLPQEHQHDSNTSEESLNLSSIMASAHDLRSFQELEAYLYRKFDAETEAPEDSSDEFEGVSDDVDDDIAAGI